MVNGKLVSDLGKQLGQIGERVASIAISMDDVKQISRDLAGTYEHFLLDEVSQVQLVALELTKLVTEGEMILGDPEENPNAAGGTTFGTANDSAFAEGELTSVIGEKQEEHPENQ